MLNEVRCRATSIRLTHISDDRIAMWEVTLEPVVPFVRDEWFYYRSDAPCRKHEPKNAERHM